MGLILGKKFSIIAGPPLKDWTTNIVVEFTIHASGQTPRRVRVRLYYINPLSGYEYRGLLIGGETSLIASGTFNPTAKTRKKGDITITFPPS